MRSLDMCSGPVLSAELLGDLPKLGDEDFLHLLPNLGVFLTRPFPNHAYLHYRLPPFD